MQMQVSWPVGRLRKLLQQVVLDFLNWPVGHLRKLLQQVVLDFLNWI